MLDWTTVLAAIGGAAVGGLSTVGGTWLFQRSQGVRTTRTRMYDELLPLVDPVGHRVSTPDDEPLDALKRAAQLAGSEDRRLVGELVEARLVYLGLEIGAEGLSQAIPPERLASVDAREQGVEDARQALRGWLERKIRIG